MKRWLVVVVTENIICLLLFDSISGWLGQFIRKYYLVLIYQELGISISEISKVTIIFQRYGVDCMKIEWVYNLSFEESMVLLLLIVSYAFLCCAAYLRSQKNNKKKKRKRSGG